MPRFFDAKIFIFEAKIRFGAKTYCQGGNRSNPIKVSTSSRGRTSAHSASRTSTSGTNGRVL
jgi:hypothetical protein